MSTGQSSPIWLSKLHKVQVTVPHFWQWACLSMIYSEGMKDEQGGREQYIRFGVSNSIFFWLYRSTTSDDRYGSTVLRVIGWAQHRGGKVNHLPWRQEKGSRDSLHSSGGRKERELCCPRCQNMLSICERCVSALSSYAKKNVWVIHS